MKSIFVYEPGLGKNLMLAFESTKENETFILNHCIQEVMNTDKGLRAFHQIGVSHIPGFHAWEPWDHKVTKEELEALIPLIEERVHLMWEMW